MKYPKLAIQMEPDWHWLVMRADVTDDPAPMSVTLCGTDSTRAKTKGHVVFGGGMINSWLLLWDAADG